MPTIIQITAPARRSVPGREGTGSRSGPPPTAASNGSENCFLSSDLSIVILRDYWFRPHQINFDLPVWIDDGPFRKVQTRGNRRVLLSLTDGETPADSDRAATLMPE